MQAEACAGLVESAIGAFGRLDVLVNNAGIQFVSPIEDFPVDKYNAIIALNLSSAFHTIRAAMRSMKAAQVRAHHQYRLGARARRLAVQVGLRRGQARHRRLDQDGRARRRAVQRALQRDLAGLRADAAWSKTKSPTR